MEVNQSSLWTFKHFKTIPEISGGSGMVFQNGNLYIIADDAFVLYKHHIASGETTKINLSPNEGLKEQVPKSKKPDFESLVLTPQGFIILGSGSTINRNKIFQLNHEWNEVIAYSLKELYEQMRSCADMSLDDFNIEGVVLADTTAYFFNRGNGPGKRNGVFVIKNCQESEEKSTAYQEIHLSDSNGTHYTFSDAIQHQDYIYFLATAETGDSTYEDGVILGSAFGIMSYQDFKLINFIPITEEYKLEGLCIYKEEDHQLSFYLCDDADTEKSGTQIFQMSIQTPFSTLDHPE